MASSFNRAEHGLCLNCNKPLTAYLWCKSCCADKFKEDFSKWTSGDAALDEFIRTTQLTATNNHGVMEWIPYNELRITGYLARGGYGEVHSAVWRKGYAKYLDFSTRQWKRDAEILSVVVKILDGLKEITESFLSEVRITVYMWYNNDSTS